MADRPPSGSGSGPAEAEALGAAAVLSQLAEGVIVADQQGRIVLVNAAAERLHGVKRLDVQPDDYTEVYHLLTMDGAPHPPDQLPLTRAVRHGETVPDARWRILRPDGTEVVAIGTARPLLDDAGQQKGAILTFRDDTARHRAEQALSESEARTRAIVEATPECVKIVGGDGSLLYMNSAGLNMIEADGFDGVCRANVLDIIAPEFREEWRANNARVCAGERLSWEFEIIGLNGTRRRMETHAVPIEGPDGKMQQLAVTRDVTARRQSEQALRESEARLRALTDHLPGGMVYQISTGADGSDRRFLYVSQSHLELTGISAEAVLADPNIAYEMIHEEDRPRLADAEAEAIEKRSIFDMEARFRRADGELRWCRIISAPREQQDGSLIWDGIQIDITAQKAAQEALRESEERFRLTADAVPQIVWITDADGGALFFNKQWFDYTGAAETLATAADVGNEYVHPDDVAATLEAFDRARRTGSVFEVEHRIRSAAGEYRWFLVRAEPYRSGEGGEIVRWYGASVDIHDRKSIEEALRLRGEEFYALADNIPTLCWMAYADGHIFWYNRRWYEYTGTGPEQMEGWGWTSVHDPDVLPRVTERWQRSIDLGDPFEMTFPLKGADGVFRPFLTRIVPIRDEAGAIIRWFGTNVDVSEQVEAERLLERRVAERTAELEAAQEQLRQSQKLEAMGQLTGGVAHDFNNLLTPIVGSLDLLQRRGLGGEREQRLIEGALQSAERAKTLVQRLLAFARRQPLQPSAVDIAALVSGMAELVASTSGPQVKVKVDVAEGLPPAKADQNQLEMAILNLAVNARDAMPDGGTITIAAAVEAVGAGHRAKLRPGQYVRLAVADTGSGMDEATLARAVEPFFSTKGIGKGTGLGLSMVHGLASQLGGGLTITSKEGLGSRIELWLPATAEPVEVSEPAGAAAAAAKAIGTALLVDDEELVRASTADMLDDLGYRVVQAASAEEALKALDGGLALDLLVTDHLMPGMTGVDLARRVKELRPGARLLIVSGYAEAEAIAPDLPRLTKPFRQADLAAMLAVASGPAE